MNNIIGNNSNSILGSDNKTMFFTRLAENEINNGNMEKAIDILEHGIQEFPNYPSSYVIYGKTLLAIGKTREAKKAFKTGLDLVGFQDTSEYYLNLIPETDVEVSTENIDSPSEIEPDQTNNNELLELADKLSNAKMDILQGHDTTADIKRNTETESPPSSGRSLVSETLARIYFNQENYSEAKEIYETLIQIQPERTDYYQRKLEEIEMKLGA